MLFDEIELIELYALSDMHKGRLKYKINKVNELLKSYVDIDKYKNDGAYQREINSKYRLLSDWKATASPPFAAVESGVRLRGE